MQRFLGVVLLGMLATGFASLPAWAGQTAAERGDLAKYEKYAEPPVDRVTYFQVQGFQYLSPDTLAIWFAVNKMYLLTVQTPCTNLQWANAIGLTAKDNVLYRDFDFVTFGHQRCKILRIVPVNELKMKQDEAVAKK